MTRDLTLFLNDMHNYSNHILEFTKDMNYESFSNDIKTILAVTRSLEIIGEASKHIPNDLKKKYPEIEWKNISGMRNVISHEYFGLDLPIIWNVVINKIPDLYINIQKVREFYISQKKLDILF